MTLEILTGESLGNIRHGFFTRRGGASSGIYSGLNCGYGSGDQSGVVSLNRSMVAEAMRVHSTNLLSLHQIHSSTVVTVDPDNFPVRPRADAIVTDEPGIALSVLTADCAPVLLADPDNGVIGAAHAGWRGALDGVTDNTIDAMVALGANRDGIQAAVGPTISQRNYEVSQEFMETFLEENPAYSMFFVNGRDGHYQFDLPSFVVAKLRTAGVDDAIWIGACTYAEPDRFYSYRRSTHLKQPDYGRLISAIVL
ncbi:peptidoglycan editing factor PgeF [Amaricoccus tamworthensis]|uniref:peptidoglycan editing factor PgeF n=1 Tax=Amaricoccus tamworthensis TaxID=57002 RepID=UPI003C7E0094